MTDNDDNTIVATNNEDNGSYVITYSYETLRYPLKGEYVHLGVLLRGDLL